MFSSQDEGCSEGYEDAEVARGLPTAQRDTFEAFQLANSLINPDSARK